MDINVLIKKLLFERNAEVINLYLTKEEAKLLYYVLKYVEEIVDEIKK